METHDQRSEAHSEVNAQDTRVDQPILPETLVDQPLWQQAASDAVSPPHPQLPMRTWYLRLKLAVEFLIAAMLLVLSAPLILVIAVLVKLTSPGPAFYSQVRVGKGGRVFKLHKLRTMRHNCEKTSGPRWSVPGDPRITALGRFLRTTHLDELPQLWNVLRGEMSLVGPRPERPEFVPDLERLLPHYGDRLMVRPGVTGLAQVQLPADTDLASVRRKLAYDLYYIRHINLWLDLRLMFCTGVRMFGVPFHILCGLFGLPRAGQVEHHYQARQAATAARSDPGSCPRAAPDMA